MAYSDVFTRHHIGDRLREDIGAFLIEQSRRLSVIFRRLVNLPRLFAPS